MMWAGASIYICEKNLGEWVWKSAFQRDVNVIDIGKYD
jgi:hypothetical protein